MKRATLILAGMLAASMLVFAACDDEPTQEEANKQFCDDMGEFVASLRVVRDLDSNSTIDEVNAARDRVRNAHDNVVESGKGVAGFRAENLQESYDDLLKAVDDVDPNSSIGDALSSVDDEVENVAKAAGEVFNDVDCKNASTDEQQSNE